MNRVFKYCLLFFLAISTVLSFDLFFSQPVLSTNSIPENTLKQDLNSEQLGEFINRTEKSWEYDYEDYFQKDFTNYSQTERQISQQLLKLSQDTNTKPAVMWAVPTASQLYLLLITPGSEPIIKSVRTARGSALTNTVNNFNREINRSRTINSRSYLPSAKLLYKWIIKPLESELKAANIDTLMLCSGSGLRSFPFAALYDGKQFLIEKYSLVRREHPTF